MRATPRSFRCGWLLVLLVWLGSPFVAWADITSNLLVRYAFDENTGTTTTDGSGNGHTADLTNGATWGTGQKGSAVSLDGSDDYVNAPSTNLGLHGGTAVSIVGWFYVNALSRSQRPMAKQISDGWNTVMFEILTTNQLRFSVQNSGAGADPTWTASTALTTGWHHLAGTWERSSGGSGDASVYIDGVSQSLSFVANGYSGSFTLEEVSSNLVLGVRPVTFASGYQGLMDEVAIYGRKLSSTDVTQHMNSVFAVVGRTKRLLY